MIYVGSFGKTLFPGLRVGYIVLPEHLVESFTAASAELYREGQLLPQAVLAEFVAEGHLGSHIRRTRTLSGQRCQILLEVAARHYGDALAVADGDAGLHLVMRLSNEMNDQAVTHAAIERNVGVRRSRGYYSDPSRASAGLLRGYTRVPDNVIPP